MHHREMFIKYNEYIIIILDAYQNKMINNEIRIFTKRIFVPLLSIQARFAPR